MIEIKSQRGYVSPTVAAQMLGVSRQRAHQMLREGRLEGFLVDVGGGQERWAVTRQSVDGAIAWRNRPRPWAKRGAVAGPTRSEGGSE